MRVLDRYIVGIVLGHVALVMAVLVTLLALFQFVNEQGWVGVGRYGNWQALRYVLLGLPAGALQLLPAGALIGALVAMGGLARGSELVVMRAAGLSVARIAASVLLAGMLLVPVAWTIGEWIAPPLAQIARVYKAVERNGSISVNPRGGAWVRDGAMILRVDGPAAVAGGGVTVIELGESRQLAAVTHASAARQQAGGWELLDAATSRFGDAAVESQAEATRRFATRTGPEFFAIAAGEPRDMSLRELSRAIGVLSGSGQDVRRHRFAFWSGVARLAAIPLAMLLTVPLLSGALQRADTGTRATVGLVLGLAYFIIQRMVESGTLAFDLNPVLLAFAPAALLALAAGLLLLRRD